MKKLLSVLLLALVALCAAPSSAACTAAPNITGAVGTHPAAVYVAPATDWITSFYRWPTAPEAAKVWTFSGAKGPIDFGAGSGIVINTGAQCVAGPCLSFSGDKITTLQARNKVVDGVDVVQLIANFAPVAEIYGARSLTSVLSTPFTWQDGITEITSAMSSNKSDLSFCGYSTANTGVMHSSCVGIYLVTPCSVPE